MDPDETIIFRLRGETFQFLENYNEALKDDLYNSLVLRLRGEI